MDAALRRLSPGTWHAYADALAMQRALGGRWPEAETVARLATEAGGDVGAALVLTRFELPAADGSGAHVPLGGCRDLHPPALVATDETALALQPEVEWNHVFVTLVTPDDVILRAPYFRGDWGAYQGRRGRGPEVALRLPAKLRWKGGRLARHAPA